MDFVACIKQIVKEYGTERVAQRSFIGLLEDYQAFDDVAMSYKLVLKHWSENGKLTKISRMSANDSQWKIDVSNIIHQTEAEGFKKEVASDLLHKLLLGIGIVDSTFAWDKEFLPKNELKKDLLENREAKKEVEQFGSSGYQGGYQRSMVSTTTADTFISTKKAKPRRTISFFRKFVSFFKSLTLFGWLIILTVAIIVFFVFKPRVSIDSKKKLEVVLSPQYCERQFTLKSNKNQLDLIADESWSTGQIIDNLLKIKVAENNTGNERTSILNVKAKHAKATLVLRQMPHVSYLNVEKDVVIEALGGETTITVSTDAFDLKIGNCPSWCEATVKDKKIILKCEKNTDNYAREAQVEIVADTAHAFLNIRQMEVDKNTPQKTSSKKKKMIIKMGHGWLEHNVGGKLLIHYKFLAEHATGKSLLVICTFHDYDKILGNDGLKDKNGEYCLFNGLVATASNPILIEQDKQEVDGILSIPYSELHLEPSFFVFGKEFAHHLICRIKIVDVDNEDKVLDKTKLEFLYSYDTSKDVE